MKPSKLSYILLITMLFSNCEFSTKTTDVKSLSKDVKKMELSEDMPANQKWMVAINNKNIRLLESLYIENALVLSQNGVDVGNREDLLELARDSDFKVERVKTIKRIQANATYDYEIGSFENADGNVMKHLIIWKTINDEDIRELEFLAETNSDLALLDDINLQRQEWMTLCNANNARNLIEKLYSKNTMYYNNERLLKGRERLVAEYEYMNNPNYNLTLEPILVEPVSNTIVYEFGQCQGSYNGKYILVWKKNTKNIWQIIFDSNI